MNVLNDGLTTRGARDEISVIASYSKNPPYIHSSCKNVTLVLQLLGTGKLLVARAVQWQDPRTLATGPY